MSFIERHILPWLDNLPVAGLVLMGLIVLVIVVGALLIVRSIIPRD